VNKIDAIIALLPVITLVLALYNFAEPYWIATRLILTFPTLLFIPGYSIMKNIFNKRKLGPEEWAYSMAISISIIVLTGYVIDITATPLPYQLFTEIACAITLISYAYGLLLYYVRGKAS